MKKFDRLIKHAYQEFYDWDRHGRCFHLSYLIRNNKIFSFATNSYSQLHLAHRFGYYVPHKTSSANYCSGRHSETEAIKRVEAVVFQPEWRRFELVNIRINRQGKISLAAPCRNCMRVIENFGIKRVYFTTNTGQFGLIRI